MSNNSNIFKSSTAKGFYGIVKGVVTRNIVHKPKPQIGEWILDDTDYLKNFLSLEIFEQIKNLDSYDKIKELVYGTVGDNPWDVQVWIPAYHGGSEPDPTKIGEDWNVGEYPWASVCGPIFKDNIGFGNLDVDTKVFKKSAFGLGTNETVPNVWSDMFADHQYYADVPSTYPGIGDIVYIAFEGGDPSQPVVIGSMMCDNNKVNYTGADSLDGSGGGIAGGLSSDSSILAPEYLASESETLLVQAIDKVTINGATGITFPLSGGATAFTMSCGFGWTYKSGNFHNGIDYACPAGTPILASHAGTATALYQSGGYGYYVKLTGVVGGVTITTYYGHMKAFYNIGLNESKVVESGDQIGYAGSTGNSTGNHLHFGLGVNGLQVSYQNATTKNTYGPKSYVDPTGFVTNGSFVVPTDGVIVLPDKRY